MKILIEIMQKEGHFDVEVNRVNFVNQRDENVTNTSRTLTGDRAEEIQLVQHSTANSVNHALNIAADALAMLKE